MWCGALWDWREAIRFAGALLLAHFWRIVAYFGPVSGLSDWLDCGNCGTEKCISGHAHMYGFFVLLTVQTFVTRTISPNSSTMKMISRCAHKVFYTMALSAGVLNTCVALYALSATYWHGHHSLRHMFYGYGAAAASFGLQVLFGPRVANWAVSRVMPANPKTNRRSRRRRRQRFASVGSR